MIGMQIGSYKVIEKLGEGGMGVVYKAIDTGLDRQVAMKVLSTDLSKNPEIVERFRAEAKAQANLNHTNLATLYAFLIHEGTAFMVMEFVDGETFQQMITRRGPIPENEAIPMFRQALLGIGYAHRAGIIHRDIKPSNLMLNKSGIVKVMDFGIAKVVGTRGLTRTGTQMGTVAYMSPEQIQNKTVDIRSDIYELGVTLYQMLTGHLPFDSDSDFEIMQNHVRTPPPPLSRFYPYVRKEVENVVLKSLEKNPDNRFQTVEQFGAALERPEQLVYTPPPDISTDVTAPVHTPSGIAPPQAPRSAIPSTPTIPAGGGAGRGVGTPTVPQAPSAPQPTVPYGAPTIPQGVTPTSPQGHPLPPPAVAQAQPSSSGSGTKKILIGGAIAVLAVAIAVVAYQMRPPKPPASKPNPDTPTKQEVIVPQSSSDPNPLLPKDMFPPASSSTSPTSTTETPSVTAPMVFPPSNDSGATAKPAASAKPKSAAKPATPAVKTVAGQEEYEKAKAAYDQARYFRPVNNSAIHWAIESRKAGNQQGKDLEVQLQGIYKERVRQFYTHKQYRMALDLLNVMLEYYPGNASLLQEQQKLQSAVTSSSQ